MRSVLFWLFCFAFAAFTYQSRRDLHPETDPKQVAKDSKPADAKAAPKLPYVLTVKTRPILNISLKAEKAKMSEVAQELSKR